MGSTRAGDGACDGRSRRIQHRCVAVLSGGIAAPRLPRQFILQEKWLLGLEALLIDRGYIAAAEIAAGHAMEPAKPLKRGKFTLNDVERVMVRGKFGRAARAPAKFKPGDRVRAKNIHPATHTRLPRYARGHVGVVERDLGCQVFPDSAATGSRDNPQWLYTVVFDGAELWGPDGDPTVKISIDAFEPYLEAA